MAYTQTPGRGNFDKTGNGLPGTLNSGSTNSIDPKLKEKAEAEANAKLNANIQAKPLGGSSDFRSEVGTATNIRQAKTPQEKAAWAKAVATGKASGKYNETVSATATATGKDMPTAPLPKSPVQPTQPPKTPEAAKNYFTREVTNQKFGGQTVKGMTKDLSAIASSQLKNKTDTNPENTKRGNTYSTGEKNTFQSREVTPQEQNLLNRNLISSSDSGFGVSPERHKAYIAAKQAISDRQDVTLAQRAVNRTGKKNKTL